MTTSPTYGRLEFVSAPSVPITSFTQDDLDNNRVVYVHNGTENFLDGFDFDVTDGQGNTLAGQNFNLTITPVNDAPVVNATASDTGTEDTDVVYTHAQLLTLIGATDVDDANANLSISITNVNNGTLVMSGGSGGAGTTFTFTPTANFAGNLTFDYQVSDDDSPTPATSAVGTATVAISMVNDAPVARDDRIGLVFDGVDDYVRIGDYAGLNVTNTVTIEAWIRPSGAGPVRKSLSTRRASTKSP